MTDPFWRGRRVLVTGHTGFIGSWLCLALHRAGATVAGVALDPPTQPSLYEAARIGSLIAKDERCDIRDAARIAQVVRRIEPEVLFHLAAQPLVRRGYATPVETYATNIMGTVHVLDALRSLRGVVAAVIMTSDKCYANDDSGRPLNEADALGGYDPYSSSKAGAEIVAASYRDSYLREGGVPLATMRAGNVIGGGDWAADRLLPDVVRAFSAGRPVSIRHPAATRPWQHVLDPIAGCMTLAHALATHGNDYAEPWNFGPSDEGRKTVSHLANLAARIWGGGAAATMDGEGHAHEAHLLSLDTSKAQSRLGWRTRWHVERAVLESLQWYKAHLGGEDMQSYTLAQVDIFSESGIHAYIVPGNICADGEATTQARYLALTGLDLDGQLRCVPLLSGTAPAGSVSLPLKKDDASSPVEGTWLRLDRAGWRPGQGLVATGNVTRALLARVHRELAKSEARAFAEAQVAPAFRPDVTAIPPSGKVIGAPEFEHLIDASLDGWLTTGRFNDLFQSRLGAFLGRKHVLTTNSGSSANLLALSALTSPLLGDRALQPGDEVITVAAGFPTTVNPILQNGLVPVFVDVSLPTYNIDVRRIETAISPRTRAIMIAHTLGNPFDLASVMKIVERHQLWLVEDCCDALGSTYQGRKVGTFGHLGTLSFYPAHHITMGEGGAVFTDDDVLKRAVESIRDWGRDCYCAPGRDNTCGKRFKWQLGQLPKGYDHKYTYSHLGYNLKITDMQAAVGVAQLYRLDGFIEARRQNFRYLHDRLVAVADRLLLPEATLGSDPSWFGFPITIRPGSGLERESVVRHLNRRRVGTRQLFAGNLLRQPYFAARPHRVSGNLECSDLVMNNTFWIGVYPGLSAQQLEFAANAVVESVAAPTKPN